MNPVATLVCAHCCTRVDASELQNSEKKCDMCRGIDADCLPAETVCVEDLHAGGHALLDQRDFNGGTGPHCDEA